MHGTLVRDVIVPIWDLTPKSVSENGVEIDVDKSRLVGTGFLIGREGHLMTAGHVLEAPADGTLCALFVRDQSWYSYSLVDIDLHPDHDVGIARLQSKPKDFVPSWMDIDHRGQNSGCDLHMWSYPENVAQHLSKVKTGNPDQYVPDMIFQRGYIRRRFPFESPHSIQKGALFYELSIVGGSCASGSPIVMHGGSVRMHKDGLGPMWPVIGIFVSEETANLRCGYAVPSYAFADWKPPKAGLTITEIATG